MNAVIQQCETAALRRCGRLVRRPLLAGLLLAVAMAGSSAAFAADAGADVSVGMVLKTLSNPYFGAMKDAAEKAAAANGVDLVVKAGRYDGDISTQISAVET